jgi:hypothetical protein
VSGLSGAARELLAADVAQDLHAATTVEAMVSLLVHHLTACDRHAELLQFLRGLAILHRANEVMLRSNPTTLPSPNLQYFLPHLQCHLQATGGYLVPPERFQCPAIGIFATNARRLLDTWPPALPASHLLQVSPNQILFNYGAKSHRSDPL